MLSDEGETVETDQALFERIRMRLEQDADVLRLTNRKVKSELLYRVAKLAAEEAEGPADPATWERGRTRPLATPKYDDPRDVLIGRLARLLDVADGGHHAASYDALLSAACRLVKTPSGGERTSSA
jgi:hypothetical protein